MKKILFLVFILATFIAIFCLSSSAADYGQQFLDPDYYEDDIALVFGLYYDGDSWIAYQDEYAGSEIFIPLFQIRVPDYSNGNFYGEIMVNDWDIDNEDYVIEYVCYEGSFAGELNATVVDLSDFLLNNLTSYTIQSAIWDDPLFFSIDNMGFSEVTVAENKNIFSNDTMFFGLYCDTVDSSIPFPNPSTLDIPTYPARPIVPDPDIPLTPGAINNFLVNTIAAPIGIFTNIFDATGTTYAVVGCFMFFMFVKFIVHPVIGSGLGSDKVKRSKPKGDSNSDG